MYMIELKCPYKSTIIALTSSLLNPIIICFLYLFLELKRLSEF